MKKIALTAAIAVLTITLGACHSNDKKENAKSSTAASSVVKTNSSKKEKKTTTDKDSESSSQESTTAPSQTTVTEEPAVNNTQANVGNQATEDNTTPAENQQNEAVDQQNAQQTATLDPETLQNVKMTISMSGADVTQFSDQQLAGFYYEAANVGGDPGTLLRAVANYTGDDANKLLENYNLANGLNADGTAKE